MTDRLKPCSFCGGELKKDRWGFYVHGRNACILTCFEVEVEPEEEEIEKWNTRKPMDRIVEQLEELEVKSTYGDVYHCNLHTIKDCFSTNCYDCLKEKAIEIVKGEV